MDSLLTLLVPEIDHRQQKEGVDFLQTKKKLRKYRLKVEGMSSEELFEVIKEGRKQIVEIQEEMNSINAQMKEAVEQDDRESLVNLKNCKTKCGTINAPHSRPRSWGMNSMFTQCTKLSSKRKGQLSPEEKSFPPI